VRITVTRANVKSSWAATVLVLVVAAAAAAAHCIHACRCVGTHARVC